MKAVWKAILVLSVILFMGLALLTPDNKYREEPLKETVMKVLNSGVNQVLPGKNKLKDTDILKKVF